ncbi:MAG: glycosyltransferase family 4 protein [Chitinophagaceae bacterium]|nr:glycosyltransferase family 4 protein [Chitinophagaceae bacterium]
MKILFLSHHWTNNSHHSQYSGFQRMVVHAARQHEVTLVTWGSEAGSYTDEHGVRVVTIKAAKRDFLFLKRIGISWKGRQLSKDFDAVHALYEDCTFFLKKNSFTVTFHVLPGITVYHELKQKVFMFLKYNVLQKRAMRRARHIVCVSTNLLEKVPGKYRYKACYIPHGVDTEFWDPALAAGAGVPGLPGDSAGASVTTRALCVGAHGLDRELLTKFIIANPSVQFFIVGLKKKLDESPNVIYFKGISDEQLRRLYADADFMIRPLTFATANNSVLEAMAMGKTIVTSRIPGITDYLDDAHCIFIDKLNGLLLEDMRSGRPDGSVIREFTIRKFSWRTVYDAYVGLYKQEQ